MIKKHCQFMRRKCLLILLVLNIGVTGCHDSASSPAKVQSKEKIALRKASDADLAGLDLRGVRELDITGREITDAGLANLERAESLQLLRARFTNITDSGIKYLANMKNLRVLDLSYSPVTDAGLVYLRDFPSLEELSLAGTEITDAGVENLTNVEKLTKLCLSETKITDDGVAIIANMKSLQELALSSTNVTTDGLRQLGELTDLGTVPGGLFRGLFRGHTTYL